MELYFDYGGRVHIYFLVFRLVTLLGMLWRAQRALSTIPLAQFEERIISLHVFRRINTIFVV